MNPLDLVIRRDGVAVIVFDEPSSPVNVISRSLFSHFRDFVDQVESDPEIRGCVLASLKQDTFIAGADLGEVLAMNDAADAEAFAREGNALLDRIEQSQKPFVAAIHGAALGGGLEIALACHYRVASDHPKTVLALPEVMVGLIPGGGGTQRLPRIVGLEHALAMIMTGSRIRARKAAKWGLVDSLVAGEESVVDHAANVVWNIAGGKLSHERRRTMRERVMELPPVRSMVLAAARKEAKRRTRGLYPAPLAALECIRTGLSKGFAAGQEQEIRSFAQLVVSREAKNLIWLFHATNEAKKLPDEPKPHEVNTIAILGAGLMGEGIASVSVPLGNVIIKDVSEGALAHAERTLGESIRRRAESGAITGDEARQQRERIATTTLPSAIATADLVIEAVFEDLALKRKVLAETEAVVSNVAVFATNTSALPIAHIAANAKYPQRVLGMHYFSPVQKMPLLEVVAGPNTADWAVATAKSFGVAQGKTVIVVRDGPGFYTTRILAPLLNEGVLLLEEGADVIAIDDAMRDFGFPVGPVTLLDEVGIDVGAHVSTDLGAAFASRGLRGSDALVKLAAAGYGGRKNRKGFYRYDDSAKKKSKRVNDEVYAFFGGPQRKSVPPADIVNRLSMVMVNEAVWCLQDGVISSARDGDLGAVLGLGFPPFRGGPFHYVDSAGAAQIVATMDSLAPLGPRFTAAPMLREMAASGAKFYPR